MSASTFRATPRLSRQLRRAAGEAERSVGLTQRCASTGACHSCGHHGVSAGSTPTAAASDLIAQLRAEQRRVEAIEHAFSHYVPSRVIERLMADPEGLSLGGETRDVTVLFADIRGFTALAEVLKGNLRRLSQVTSAILDPISEIVEAHGGTIDKYMGDCVMAFWGAPQDDPDHARHAVDAAHAMLAVLPALNRYLQTAFDDIDLPAIEIGIGINSGECVVGNHGSARRFDYSVLGDPVNVASRLQQLCKTYEAPLLVGEETARRLSSDLRLSKIDRVALRGRVEKQDVFGLATHAPRHALLA